MCIDSLASDSSQNFKELRTQRIFYVVSFFLLGRRPRDKGGHMDLAHRRDERYNLYPISEFKVFLGNRPRSHTTCIS